MFIFAYNKVKTECGRAALGQLIPSWCVPLSSGIPKEAFARCGGQQSYLQPGHGHLEGTGELDTNWCVVGRGDGLCSSLGFMDRELKRVLSAWLF